MSLSKEDKVVISDMIAAGIAAAITAAQGAPDTVEQAAAKAKKLKTTFDDRRAMAADAKAKYDAADV